MEFHYPWILILIVFPAWEYSKDVWFLGLTGKPYLAAKYQKLWYTPKKKDRPTLTWIYSCTIKGFKSALRKHHTFHNNWQRHTT